MKRNSFRISLLGLLAVALLVGTWVTGCRRDSNKPKIVQRSGRVSSIDKDSGEVKMWYYHRKSKEEIEIAGKLDPNVEILINGAAATLDDVKIDDKVLVTGRVTVTDTDMQLVATRVEIERPVTEASQAVSAPASEPATP